MDIYPTKTTAIKLFQFYEMQQLFLLRHTCLGQCREQSEYLPAIAQIAASQFADDERMAQHMLVLEQLFQAFVPLT
jgi:hypothetical protein